MAVREAAPVHVEPARQLSRSGPLAVKADVEDQGPEGLGVRALADGLHLGEEHSGEILEARLVIFCRRRDYRRTARGCRRTGFRPGFTARCACGLREQRLPVLLGAGRDPCPWFLGLRKSTDRRAGSLPIRFFGWIQETESDAALARRGKGQPVKAGERRGNSAAALGQPAAEPAHRAAQLPDFRGRSGDLAVGAAKGAGAADDPPAEVAGGVSDPYRCPGYFFALLGHPANPLAGRRPVLLGVPVGRRNPGEEPANPDPESVESWPRLSEPRADSVESWRCLFRSLEEAERGHAARDANTMTIGAFRYSS